MLVMCPKCFNKTPSDTTPVSCKYCGETFDALPDVPSDEVLPPRNKFTMPRIPTKLIIIGLFILLLYLYIRGTEDNKYDPSKDTTSVERNSDPSPIPGMEKEYRMFREIDRMNEAKRLDRIEKERREIDKYREYK